VQSVKENISQGSSFPTPGTRRGSRGDRSILSRNSSSSIGGHYQGVSAVSTNSLILAQTVLSTDVFSRGTGPVQVVSTTTLIFTRDVRIALSIRFLCNAAGRIIWLHRFELRSTWRFRKNRIAGAKLTE
jgi:hypothetical protein